MSEDVGQNSNPSIIHPKAQTHFLLYNLTAFISALAFIFSVASTISCTFTKRNFSARVVNVSDEDLDLLLGIWTWRGLALTKDDDTCFTYDELLMSSGQHDDKMMTIVRTVSVLAGFCGGFSMCLAILLAFHVVMLRHRENNNNNCDMLMNMSSTRSTSRRRYNNFLVLPFICASVLEGLKLLIFEAGICTDDRFEGSVATYDNCRSSSGAYICISSAGLSFLAGFILLAIVRSVQSKTSIANSGDPTAIDVNADIDGIHDNHDIAVN